ncbi:hypothetical protein [Streptomyces sp. NPDC046332]|uniref:hypothetical protein n=1 Tax=Streptomyces sp. NPDC046332 TaxID=3155133 RepID=UPI0033F79667
MDAPHPALGRPVGLRHGGRPALRRRFCARHRPPQHGLHPYDWAPGRLNLYWSPLALFDALAALFLIRGKRRGTDLACAIMATDLAANWYAVYGVHHSNLAAQPGLRRLTVLAVLVLGTAPVIRQHRTN